MYKRSWTWKMAKIIIYRKSWLIYLMRFFWWSNLLHLIIFTLPLIFTSLRRSWIHYLIHQIDNQLINSTLLRLSGYNISISLELWVNISSALFLLNRINPFIAKLLRYWKQMRKVGYRNKKLMTYSNSVHQVVDFYLVFKECDLLRKYLLVVPAILPFIPRIKVEIWQCWVYGNWQTWWICLQWSVQASTLQVFYLVEQEINK